MKRNGAIGAFSLLLLLAANGTPSLAQGDQEVLFRAIEIVPLYSDGFSFSLMAITDNGGKNWQYTRHIERDMRDRQVATSSGYPSIIQGRDDTLHVVYSYHHRDREGGPSKTIMYVQFNEAWVKQGRTSQGK